MGAYSKDLRLKVLAAAVDRGVPSKEVVGVFGVSLATLKRWLKRREEGEGLDPKPSSGRTPTILATDEEKRALWVQLEANDDDATLERHRELWKEERGIAVSISTMSRAVRKLGWTRKKGRWSPPSATSKRELLGGSA
jgi:transposase